MTSTVFRLKSKLTLAYTTWLLLIFPGSLFCLSSISSPLLPYPTFSINSLETLLVP